MDETTMRRLLTQARVGRLATVDPHLRPHLVPCCFVLDGETIYSAVDAKPKTTLALRRLTNLRTNPAASLLVDHYDDDWSRLWWVRVDAVGRIVDDGRQRTNAIELLTAKYSQYIEAPPPGVVVALDVLAWRGWP